MSHTPGPWRLEQGDVHDWDSGDGFTIMMGQYDHSGGRAIHHLHYAGCIYPEDSGYAEAAANARLIAAAPDLLEALKALTQEALINMTGGAGHVIDDALTAIAKAEGDER